MHSKKIEGKLKLNKATVANLSNKSMADAKAGIGVIVPKTESCTYVCNPPETDEYTVCYCSWVYSCDFATCSPSWCGLECR